MYHIAKDQILSGEFELADMLLKLNKLWLKSMITEEQLNELTKLAREHANPEMSNDIIKRLDDHETRLRKIEGQLTGGTVPSPEPNQEYPAWVDGRSYRKGDKVTFKGKKYLCVLNEYTDSTVWSPEAYPGYWQAV